MTKKNKVKLIGADKARKDAELKTELDNYDPLEQVYKLGKQPG